VNAILNSL